MLCKAGLLLCMCLFLLIASTVAGNKDGVETREKRRE